MEQEKITKEKLVELIKEKKLTYKQAQEKYTQETGKEISTYALKKLKSHSPKQSQNHLESQSNIQILKNKIKTIELEKRSLEEYINDLKMKNDILLSSFPSIPLIEKIPEIKTKHPQNRQPCDASILISDWHSHEVVSYDEMEGFNQYDFQILCNRAWLLCEEIKNKIAEKRESRAVEKLHISALGDMISGDIHEELRETNQASAITGCVQLSIILSQFIAILSQDFDEIIFTGISGNHGRNTAKPRFKKRAQNNYDNLIYQITSGLLHKYIEKGRVKFNIPNSIRCIVKKRGWGCLLDHGDQIKCHQGISYYGIDRDNSNEHGMRRKVMGGSENYSPIDFQIREMGHFHENSVLDRKGTMNIMNGSLVGANEFSRNRLQAVTPAKQIMYFINEKEGVESILPIYVQNASYHNFSIDYQANMGEQIINSIINDME